MANGKHKPRGYANRTPWRDAIREVPAAWLEDEACRSSSPSSLLAAWKRDRGGVPAHIMLDMLRRRIRDQYPELIGTAPPAAGLHRAQDMLTEIWAGTGATGKRNPTWQLVEGVVRMAWEHVAARAKPDQQDHAHEPRAREPGLQ